MEKSSVNLISTGLLKSTATKGWSLQFLRLLDLVRESKFQEIVPKISSNLRVYTSSPARRTSFSATTALVLLLWGFRLQTGIRFCSTQHFWTYQLPGVHAWSSIFPFSFTRIGVPVQRCSDKRVPIQRLTCGNTVQFALCVRQELHYQGYLKSRIHGSKHILSSSCPVESRHPFAIQRKNFFCWVAAPWCPTHINQYQPAENPMVKLDGLGSQI